MRRCIAAGLVVVGLLFAPGAAAAEPPVPMRVVVRIVAASDQLLLSRIDGQVADLDVALVPDRSAPLAASDDQRFARARALARRHRARVVVWFAGAGPDGVRIYVAEPGRDTLFARRVATADASARAEAVAIVVRSTLQALAQGGEIGVKVPRPAAPPPVAAPAPAPPAADWDWSLGVQGQVSFDGESSPGQQGFQGRVDLTRGRLQLGLVGVVGLGDQLSDAMTTVHLARHAAGLGASLRALRAARAALWIGVDAGVILYSRSTTVVGGDLEPAPPATTAAGFASPRVRGQWRPLAGHGLWLTCEVAAAVVIGAPELRYQLGGAPVVRNQLWPVQPSVGVGLRLEGL
jgi:hypothetical protein